MRSDRAIVTGSAEDAATRTGNGKRSEGKAEKKDYGLDRVSKNMSESQTALITDQRAELKDFGELFNNIQPISVGV